MKKRKELSKLDDSLFKVIENRKLAFIVGGGSTGSTATIIVDKTTGEGTGSKDDGDDSYPGE